MLGLQKLILRKRKRYKLKDRKRKLKKYYVMRRLVLKCKNLKSRGLTRKIIKQ